MKKGRATHPVIFLSYNDLAHFGVLFGFTFSISETWIISLLKC